jgi:hypothetical protein
MIDSQLKTQLIRMAARLIQRGYMSKSKEFEKDAYLAATPNNFIATYKELLEKFMVVDKLAE